MHCIYVYVCAYMYECIFCEAGLLFGHFDTCMELSMSVYLYSQRSNVEPLLAHATALGFQAVKRHNATVGFVIVSVQEHICHCRLKRLVGIQVEMAKASLAWTLFVKSMTR